MGYTSESCSIFYWSTDSCTSLREDYRQECSLQGGPVDKRMDTCMQADMISCDKYLEVDCEYSGEKLWDSDAMPDSGSCQELCQTFKEGGCLYWVYDLRTSKCSLYKTDKRTCTAIGGPKEPPFEDCPEVVDPIDPVECCKEKGVAAECIGNCIIHLNHARSITSLKSHSLCDHFKKEITECVRPERTTDSNSN